MLGAMVGVLYCAASADRRLILFYLANDVLQNGRRKGADLFLEQFQDPLRQAVTWIGWVHTSQLLFFGCARV